MNYLLLTMDINFDILDDILQLMPIYYLVENISIINNYQNTSSGLD